MDAKINIAKILKDKPQGTKLYDLLRNIDVGLDKVHTTDVGTYIECTSTNEVGSTLLFDYSKLGTEKSWLEGLQILLPSKDMLDWGKFAWKKGDVLISNDGKVKVIFEKFRSDTYQSFIGKHHLDSLDDKNLHYQDEGEYPTFNFSLESEDAAQTYINTIERRLGGKLNRETLEIEKQTEFKDGDIIKMTWDKYSAIVIFWEYSNFGKGFDSHVFFNIKTKIIEYNIHGHILQDAILRLATEEEKKQLFLTLAKEGKAWDAEKKQVVVLKPKVELKPFDKVLVRDDEDHAWQVSLFGYKDATIYRCNNGCSWNQCIPYFGNENLLGTTKNVEG